ncbi:hypothetical protein [Pedobacter xixiisoli]|uniref:Uncharacterized protein n=1 Tax=Pedobacter xixiisoli TaxID=1476464 RepID=A0A285ZP09_9SPHI|nr:hypothetical protein [Pedobacter xixiisoli]SOD11350.1 hypothetical protein SAMN06297358_0105 [Pedobacter xixiisoli]
MKRAIFICFLIINSVFVFAQKTWVKQRVTNRVIVAFPTAPSKTAGTTFALKDTTNTVYTVTYSFIAQNLKIAPKAFNKLVMTNEFASEFLSGLQTTLAGYNLEQVKIKQNKNYVSYLTEGKNENEKKSIFMHIIFVDGVYYSLSVVIPDGESLQNKDIFLNNFQVTK